MTVSEEVRAKIARMSALLVGKRLTGLNEEETFQWVKQPAVRKFGRRDQSVRFALVDTTNGGLLGSEDYVFVDQTSEGEITFEPGEQLVHQVISLPELASSHELLDSFRAAFGYDSEQPFGDHTGNSALTALVNFLKGRHFEHAETFTGSESKHIFYAKCFQLAYLGGEADLAELIVLQWIAYVQDLLEVGTVSAPSENHLEDLREALSYISKDWAELGAATSLPDLREMMRGRLIRAYMLLMERTARSLDQVDPVAVESIQGKMHLASDGDALILLEAFVERSSGSIKEDMKRLEGVSDFGLGFLTRSSIIFSHQPW